MVTNESPEKRFMNNGEFKNFGIGGLICINIRKIRNIIPKYSRKSTLCGTIEYLKFSSPFLSTFFQ
jgi:hypothetical protein